MLGTPRTPNFEERDRVDDTRRSKRGRRDPEGGTGGTACRSRDTAGSPGSVHDRDRPNRDHANRLAGVL